MPSLTRTLGSTALCLTLAASAVAAGTLPSAAATPSAATTATSASAARAGWPTLRPGSSGVDVRTAQHLLREMSTLASPVGDSGVLMVDGRYGRDTTRAVKEFQTRYGLRADGVVGARTWEALVVTVGRSSRNSAVMGAQIQLRALGHSVAVDGKYGPQTAAAVTRFQRTAGLRADGVIGRATWRALLSRTAGES
jgi:peptidoglycan hydrolase-like protein with peptidoglycan-binding domain